MDAEDSGLKIKEKQAHGYACFRMVEDATRTQTVYAACFAVVIIIVLIIITFVSCRRAIPWPRYSPNSGEKHFIQ